MKPVAVVTGASSGLGLSLVTPLLKQGFEVVQVARTNRVKLNSKWIHFIACDLSQSEARRDLLERCLSECSGRLHLLINNAGTGSLGDILQTPLEEFQRCWEVNALAAIDLCQQAIPIMESGGMIVNVTSGVAKRGIPFESPYCVSKAALRSFTESLRVELVGSGIQVMDFSPGPLASPFLTARKNHGLPRKNLNSGGKNTDHVAQVMIRSIQLRRTRVVLGWKGRLVHWLNFFFPAFVDKAFIKAFDRALAPNSSSMVRET